jgi:hypothetical protein
LVLLLLLLLLMLLMMSHSTYVGYEATGRVQQQMTVYELMLVLVLLLEDLVMRVVIGCGRQSQRRFRQVLGSNGIRGS